MSDDLQSPPISWRHDAEIALPSAKHERRLAIREVEWIRIKRTMKQVNSPIPSWSFIYSAFIGVGISAALTVIPLAYSTGLPNWVVPLYVVMAFFSILFSVCLYCVERAFCKKQREAATAVLEDMDEIDRLFTAAEANPLELPTPTGK